MNEQWFNELIQSGWLKEEEKSTFLAQAESAHQTWLQALIEKHPARERELIQTLATLMNLPYVDLLHTSPQGFEFISLDTAKKHEALPLGLHEGVLWIAPANPFDLTILETLSFTSQRQLQPVLAPPSQIRRALHSYAASAEASTPANYASSIDLSAPQVAYLDQMLKKAIELNASDIHIAPQEHGLHIRCRVDGHLRELPQPTETSALISQIKALAHLNITETRLPQDGRLKINQNGRSLEFRVATLPTEYGESISLRALNHTALDLTAIGLPTAGVNVLQTFLQSSHGMGIVTGPTGSGKTTTLYACLKYLNRPDVKIITIEDPVEYEIADFSQIQINEDIGLTFAKALRSLLRQDPDYLLVGETRDSETAGIAIQAALTGHLVLTSLHTPDGPSAITRLLDLGVEPYLISATVQMILAQRLIRRLCHHCRAAISMETIPAPYRTFFNSQSSCFQEVGCKECQGSGYQGRLAIFEWLQMDDSLRELVVERASSKTLREQAIAKGMIPLFQDGLRYVASGETALDEILPFI